MARRRASRTRTVYRTAKRSYRRAKTSGIGGKFKPAIAGAICGAGPNFAKGFLGQWATPVVAGAVGYFLNDKTSMWFAGYSAGGMIGGGNGGAIGGLR